ncbi:hypothetical protein N41_0425 [Lactococcus cremoris]|nr:hypothetical protein N41_0425 [Lactococcus cremoris]
MNYFIFIVHIVLFYLKWFKEKVIILLYLISIKNLLTDCSVS